MDGVAVTVPSRQNLTSPGSSLTQKYSLTPVTMALVTIMLLVIFGIAIAVFFLAFNHPNMHEITVFNNCSETINIIFGVVSPDQTLQFFRQIQINRGISYQFNATPGVSIIVQGYRNGDTTVVDGINPFTTVELTLAGKQYNGPYQVTDGTEIINSNILINTNASDEYDVSLQGGYNLPVTIKSTNAGCGGPVWNYGINQDLCPTELQSPGTGSNYEVCLAPCTALGGTAYCCTEPNICTATGGCQQSWPDPDYYDVFRDACPECLVTNCETANFICTSQNGLNQYLITFCPVSP